MNPKVLILTSIYDFSADLVALILQEWGVPFIRINKENIEEYEISVEPTEPIINFHFQGSTVGNNQNVKSVWFRQPVFLRNTPPQPLSPEEQLRRSHWSAFLRGLSILDNAAWMNWPQATYLAESKPYQLYMAKRCGLNVPKTLISNHAKAIRASFSSDIIIKSLDTVLLREKDDVLFTYTSKCDIGQIEPNTVKKAPILVQEFLEPKVDYRVTIIGSELFSVKILANGTPVSGDWRLISRDELEYVDCELPKEMKVKCYNLMESLGLKFGAIDLVETKNDFVFLEINPTGEWGWLNTEERRLDRSIASWLSCS